jgi:hypothetical protein
MESGVVPQILRLERWGLRVCSLAPRLPSPCAFQESLQRHRQFQRGLPAELDDDPLGLLRFDDVEYILFGQGLKVEAIAGVVVRGDRLGLELTMMVSKSSARRA